MTYSVPRRVAFEVLLKIYERKAYSSVLLNATFAKKKLSSREKNLITELVYGTLRWQNRLDYIISQLSSRKKEDIELNLLILLRLGIYQVSFLTHIPERVAVKETVELARLCGHRGKVSFVNAILREFCRRGGEISLPEFERAPFDYLVFTQSHPEWLVRRWVKRWGLSEGRRMIEANNEEAPLVLRVNVARTDEEDLIRKLSDEGVVAIPSSYVPNALVVKEGNPLATSSFREGLFYLQDEASQMIPLLLSSERGKRVLDACAAPGGKTIILTELMGGEGFLVANDRHQGRIRLIRRNLERLGLSGGSLLISDMLAPPLSPSSFNAVLLDAPCTGLGRIRRAPEIKWHRREEDIEKLSLFQRKLLIKVSELLEKGGELLYATCTLEPEETTELIKEFLEERKDFRLKGSPLYWKKYHNGGSSLKPVGPCVIFAFTWRDDG